MSKLKCQPWKEEKVSEEEQLKTTIKNVTNPILDTIEKIDSRLETMENVTNPILGTMEKIDSRLEAMENNILFKCQDGNDNYKFHNNTCYYFERQKMTYLEAQINCKRKTGYFGGRLFKPHTKEESIAMFDLAKSVFGNNTRYLMKKRIFQVLY